MAFEEIILQTVGGTEIMADVLEDGRVFDLYVYHDSINAELLEPSGIFLHEKVGAFQHFKEPEKALAYLVEHWEVLLLEGDEKPSIYMRNFSNRYNIEIQ